MDFFSFIGFICFIFLLISHVNLRSRVDQLERRSRSASRAEVVPIVPLDASVLSYPSPSPAPAPTPLQMEPEGERAPDWWDRFVAWVQEDWLLKLGALMLIIGFGWFVSYAFLHNWIGPMGRIALGLITGALLLLLGYWRMQRFTHQGSIFLVLGAGTVLMTVFAARTLYDFFTPLSAMAIMFLASAFVGLASVQFRMRSLAFMGLLLASSVPLLVASGVRNDVGLFSYLLLVTLGALWVVVITGWRDLVIAALTMITLYSAPYWSVDNPHGFDTLTFIAFGFVVVFFTANVFAFLRDKEGGAQGDIIGAVWTGLFLTFWILSGVDRELQSLMFALWTVVFAAAAFLLYVYTGNRKPLLTYAGVGILLLGVATARELDGAVLTIAFTLEALVVTFLSYALLRDQRMTGMVSGLFAIPVVLSLGDIVRYPVFGGSSYPFDSRDLNISYTPLFHEHFFVLFTLTLSFLLLGYFFLQARRQTGGGTNDNVVLHQFYLVVGSVYGYLLLWLALHEVNPPDTATMIALTCYTLIGLATYLHGRMHDLRPFRIYGGVLLGFVVCRLFLVEVWNMELIGRIITFVLIGTLLMSTAFLGRKRPAPTPPVNEIIL